MSTAELPLRHHDGTRLTFQLPMLDVRAWRAATGRDENSMLAEIDLGKLRWAWHLERAGAERKFVLFWNRSLAAWLAGDSSSSSSSSSIHQPETHDEVLAWILPPKAEAFTCVELTRLFNCNSGHVHNLLKDKLLTLAPGQGKLSSRQSPLITRASVVRLLKERQMV